MCARPPSHISTSHLYDLLIRTKCRTRADHVSAPTHLYIAARDGRRRTFCPATRVKGQDVWTVYIICIYIIHIYTTLAGAITSQCRVYNIITVRAHPHKHARARAHSEPDDGRAASEKGRPSGFQRYLILFFSVVGGRPSSRRGASGRRLPTYGRRSSTRHGSRPAHVEHVAHTFTRVF